MALAPPPVTPVMDFIDLEHAQLDVTNATFAKGRVSLPGGVVELAEGSKLSFHGTLMAGELTGAVVLHDVTVARDELALQGTGGRADLHLAWRRDGDKAIVDASLTNLALTTQGLTHKDADGDYVSLGAGRISGGTVSFSSSVLLDARGVPRTDVLPTVKGAALSVPSFSGELLGARQSSLEGNAEVGRSAVEGSLSFSAEAGLMLKAKVAHVDAQVSGVQMQRAGRTIDVERARLMGHSGSIDFSPTRVLVDAKQLAWDAIVREVSLRSGALTAKGTQVRITGEGRFDYDSRRDLRLEGTLQVTGGVSGAATLPARTVTVDPVGGLVVR
jgi:hypothetical protein